MNTADTDDAADPTTWELVIADLATRNVSPPAILAGVIADAKERDRIGRERHGRPLRPFAAPDPLGDASRAAINLAACLKNASIEAESWGPDSRPGMCASRMQFERRVLRCQYQEALSMCIHLRAAIRRRDEE